MENCGMSNCDKPRAASAPDVMGRKKRSVVNVANRRRSARNTPKAPEKGCLGIQQLAISKCLEPEEDNEDLDDEENDDYDAEIEVECKGKRKDLPLDKISRTKRKEKLRTEEFCRAFNRLKSAIPIHPKVRRKGFQCSNDILLKDQSAQKLSRLEILRRTCKYITFLQQLLDFMDSEEQQQQQQQQEQQQQQLFSFEQEDDQPKVIVESVCQAELRLAEDGSVERVTYITLM